MQAAYNYPRIYNLVRCSAKESLIKLHFESANDGQYHQYCLGCNAETVSPVSDGIRTYYACGTCHEQYERSIVIDPAIKWWLGDDGEYWHESAGTFVRDKNDRFLFFERTLFPFQLTVPAGHVDIGEDAQHAAAREVAEEANIYGAPEPVATYDIVGDSCRRGSDAHRWHAHRMRLSGLVEVTILEEGRSPAWLELEEAQERDLTTPVRYIIEHCFNELTD